LKKYDFQENKKANAQIFLYLHNQKELSGCSFCQ